MLDSPACGQDCYTGLETLACCGQQVNLIELRPHIFLPIDPVTIPDVIQDLNIVTTYNVQMSIRFSFHRPLPPIC